MTNTISNQFNKSQSKEVAKMMNTMMMNIMMMKNTTNKITNKEKRRRSLD
jgi:hypothetical protein